MGFSWITAKCQETSQWRIWVDNSAVKSADDINATRSSTFCPLSVSWQKCTIVEALTRSPHEYSLMIFTNQLTLNRWSCTTVHYMDSWRTQYSDRTTWFQNDSRPRTDCKLPTDVLKTATIVTSSKVCYNGQSSSRYLHLIIPAWVTRYSAGNSY
jgi:hypothetical protein